jgi:hypothetical protein
MPLEADALVTEHGSAVVCGEQRRFADERGEPGEVELAHERVRSRPRGRGGLR